MVAMYGYHSTNVENVASIQEHGLEARQTSEHNFSWITTQPSGVYFLPEDKRDRNGSWGAGGAGSGLAVVKIDLLGLKLNQDNIIPNARYVTENIPPERLRVYKPERLIGPCEWWYSSLYAPFDALEVE